MPCPSTYEPDWSAELQLRATGCARAKLELRAPAATVPGPHARPKLEVEAPHATPHAMAHRGAFTLVELLVVLAVLAILALLLVPAAARTQADSRAFQCLNNNRQLNRAWRMWSDDNQDRLLAAAPSPDPSALPWVTGVLDYNPGNPSNWDPSVDIEKSPMWLYCGTNLGIWKCPSDQSQVLVNGVARPRVRSFAMNYFLPPSSAGLAVTIQW